MTDSRLTRQIAFVVELDKLKTVLRQTLLADSSRRETDAEHSWHVATMALVLAEYAPPGTDIARAACMLLLHDVVEIDAGDTFIHDAAGNATKAAREQAAADRLFGLLPADQGAELRALWEEFEDADSASARYAHALDRLQPILNNFATQGGTWRPLGVRADQVLGLVGRIARGSPELAAYARGLVEEAVRRGYLAAAAPPTSMSLKDGPDR
ncbi:MAG: HD domain-containing protein [Magnetospirillum sp.]|nr:HD domain-containing protein [Magnetospirillum sp.]